MAGRVTDFLMMIERVLVVPEIAESSNPVVVKFLRVSRTDAAYSRKKLKEISGGGRGRKGT